MNNISVIPKDKCTGCLACLQICPKECIVKIYDEDGFWYPFVKKESCINCGRCLKTCVVHSSFTKRYPLECFAVYNKDEGMRLKSSSGGIFIALAKYVIENGGIVIGAVFDKDYNVVLKAATNLNEVYPMMGSKYVQANVEETFKECKCHLEANKFVLFTGTPCQIAGLHKFLGKEYSHLITMDFVCHGAPNPSIWQQYLTEMFSEGKYRDVSCIGDITFRDKKFGWEKYSVVIRRNRSVKPDRNSVLLYDRYDKNPYMKGFLNDLYLRESCYYCPSKHLSSNSDIMVGDFWGVDKLGLSKINDHKGISIVSLNSDKAKLLFSKIEEHLEKVSLTFEQLIESNSNIIHCARKNDKKIERFKEYRKRMSLADAICRTVRIPFFVRVINSIKYRMNIDK